MLREQWTDISVAGQLQQEDVKLLKIIKFCGNPTTRLKSAKCATLKNNYGAYLWQWSKSIKGDM